MSGRPDPDAIEVIRPYGINNNNKDGNTGNANDHDNGNGNGDANDNGENPEAVDPNADAAGWAAREEAAAAEIAAAEAASSALGTDAATARITAARATHAAIVAERAHTDVAAKANHVRRTARPVPFKHYYNADIDVVDYTGDSGDDGQGSGSPPSNKDSFPPFDAHPLSGVGAGGEDGDAYGTQFLDSRSPWQRWYEYVAYYVPIIQWLPKYKCFSTRLDRRLMLVGYIHKDLFAGLTLASISIPMSLSYAAYHPISYYGC
jgi:hypothetical protein